LSFGLLASSEHRTVTSMMTHSGRAERDWSADYRVFSRGRWDPHANLFRPILSEALALDPLTTGPVVVALDDTHLTKCGTKIPGVSYKRDPQSPKFRPNFIRAQRFSQAGLVIPFGPGPQPCRSFPIAFMHAPAAPKPPHNATETQQQDYRRAKKETNLSTYGVNLIHRIREDLDSTTHQDRTLLMAVDGGYTNQTILRRLPERTHLIGRIRKDAALRHLPAPRESGRGRTPSYGPIAPTPDQLRQDDSVPWNHVTVFGAGRVHECRIKESAPLLWPKIGSTTPFRLIVIAPLGYRLTKKGRILYRQPAYLITTDLDTPVEQLVQAYFRRWEIEVNHRDEKQLIGVGQARVRAPESAHRVPAFAVASYSMLLLAAAHAYGLAASAPITDLPKWQAYARSQTRLPTEQIASALRSRIAAKAIQSDLPNFSHFANRVERSLKCPKGVLSTAQAIHYACN
jgi:hypothetical protein